MGTEAYAAIGDPALLLARGLFVAEGRLVVRRVLEDGRFCVQSVLVNRAAHRDLAPVLERLPPTVPVYVRDARELSEITGFNVHRGCLALVERPPDRAIDDVIAAARRIVVLEDIANPDNIGGVFRNVAALGGDAVILSPACADPLYRKSIRTSMAATLRVPYARLPVVARPVRRSAERGGGSAEAGAEDWPGGLVRLRAAGFTLVALTPREPSERLDVLAAAFEAPRVALIAGNEGAGLTPAVEAAADRRVRIPIEPGVDSLNVAVAVGIALYALQGRA